MILLRVQPVIPWNILNYILSVTSCTARDFYIGTFIGMAPGTLTFLYVGVNLKSVQEIVTGKREATPVELTFMVISMAAVVLTFHIISKESKKQLMCILEKNI